MVAKKKSTKREQAFATIARFIEKAKRLIPGFEGIELVKEQLDADGQFEEPDYEDVIEIRGSKFSQAHELVDGVPGEEFGEDELEELLEAACLLRETNRETSW